MNIPRVSRQQVSKHFFSNEFRCRCLDPKCTETIIDEELLAMLDKLRDEVGKPVVITSGYRCFARQTQLLKSGLQTSKKRSQHELGKAVDIMVDGMTGLELEEVAKKVGFKSIGVAPMWIHVDTRSDKDRRWIYK
jgi:uncharacterized protein YcbK (DUF882 family)